MRKHIGLIALIIISSLAVWAQPNDSSKFKNQLSFGIANLSNGSATYVVSYPWYDYANSVYYYPTNNIQAIVDDNNRNSVALMYRFYPNDKHAWRLGTQVSIKSFNTNSENTETEYDLKNYQVNIGHEWINKISKNTHIAIGVDGFINVFNAEDYSSYDYSGSTSENTIETSVIGYGLSPFIGVHYKIGDRLSLSAETGIILEAFSGDQKSVYTYNYTYIDGSSETNKNTEDVDGIRLLFNPLKVISINLNF